MTPTDRVSEFPARTRGVSLLELLVLLAVAAVLLAAGAVVGWPSAARTLARSLAGLLDQARLEAVGRNQPVAVLWLPDLGEFRAVTHSWLAEVCASGTTVARLPAGGFGRGASRGVAAGRGGVAADRWGAQLQRWGRVQRHLPARRWRGALPGGGIERRPRPAGALAMRSTP